MARTTFWTLPREIRDEIYTYAFVIPGGVNLNDSNIEVSKIYGAGNNEKLPGLLQPRFPECRLKSEAYEIYATKNHFWINVDQLWKFNRGPYAAPTATVPAFKELHHHVRYLWVSFDAAELTYGHVQRDLRVLKQFSGLKEIAIGIAVPTQKAGYVSCDGLLRDFMTKVDIPQR